MNPNLVRIIRERMQSQTTEQLLELWVINDRATWSPETFEAVHSILAERGKTEVPPQNDPPPVAERRTLRNDPVAAYWMQWLRPVLWAAVVVSGLQLAYYVTRAGEWWQYTRGPWWEVARTAAQFALPAWLFAAATAAVLTNPRPGVWWALLLYTGAALAVGLFDALTSVYAGIDTRRFLASSLFTLLYAALTIAPSLVLPFVLYVLLRRPEIRSVFFVVTGHGFEPAVAGNDAVATSTTAPAETPQGPASPAGSSSTEGRC